MDARRRARSIVAVAAALAVGIVFGMAVPSFGRTGSPHQPTSGAAAVRSRVQTPGSPLQRLGIPSLPGPAAGGPRPPLGAALAPDAPSAQWTATYLPTDLGCNYYLYCYPAYVGGGESVAFSPDASTVYVTGLGQGHEKGYNFTTIAYDAATGTQIWLAKTNVSADDEANAIVTSPDGSKVFVTGFSASGSKGYDYLTVAYDATTGARLWSARYNGPANADDYAWAIGVAPDGSKVF